MSENNIKNISQHKTPFYYYDLALLQKTLNILAQDTTKFKAILLDILIDKEENEQNKNIQFWTN